MKSSKAIGGFVRSEAIDHVILETLSKMGPLALALLDENLRYLWANELLAELNSRPLEAHIGQPLAAMVPPGALPIVEPLLRQVLATGHPLIRQPMTGMNQRSSGRMYHVEVSCFPLALPPPGQRVLLVAIDDSTERWQAEQRLKQSELLLAEAQALVGLGSWQWNIVSDEGVWSDELQRLFGFAPGTFRGSYGDFLALLPPEERPRVDQAMQRSLATGEPFHVEYRVVRPDGEERIVESRGTVERCERGRPVRMMGAVLDITRWKRAEQLIREQQRFVDAIVEHIPNMIFVKDAKELRFVRFNRAGEELLGYPREALIGKTDSDFFPRDETEQFTAQDRKVLREKQVLECADDPIHTRYKGVRILRSRKVPILDDKGDPAYLLGISEDITEHKRTEAFRLSDLLVQSMVDYAVFLLDAKGRVQTWNAGAERVTGYTADEILGQSISILHAQPGGNGLASLLDQAVAQGHVTDEGPWMRKDGQPIWRITEITAIRNERDSVDLFGTVTRDISERKRAEDERERLLVEQREALRLRDEFLSVASHELRTPVSALKLQAEILKLLSQRPRGELESMLPPLINKILRQTDRLEKHVASLLDVTRLSAGRVELQLSEIDLCQIAETVVARFQEELGGTPAINLHAPSQALGLWDPLRLDQVLTNLLSNAVKYGLDRPIDVWIESDAHEARIIVQDRGIGIAQEDQARIFQQFERAVSARNYGGLGLGLFIVRQIVQVMQGSISVDSRPGEGATFTVRLPNEQATNHPRDRR